MAIPLPVIGAPASGEKMWQAFGEMREALVARMEMDVCDGCDGCGLRCMDGFRVTRAEFEEVRVYLATQPLDEVARVRDQPKTFPWPGAEETGATVTCCRFRDREKNNCSIYPVRPTVCRLFGHTHWLPCPIGAVGHYPEDAPGVWERYETFERRTWAEWDLFTTEFTENAEFGSESFEKGSSL